MTESSSWIVSFVFCCILFLFDCVILKLPARDTVYTVSLFGCYACCPEMYWHVSTSFDLFYCFLVDVIVYFSTLSNVSRWSFPHFNLL